MRSAAWKFFLLLVFWSCAGGSSALELRRRVPKHAENLILAQVETSESISEHQPLYSVQADFAVHELVPSDGATLIFDHARHSLRLSLGVLKANPVAWGRFDDNIEETGWSELFIETTDSASVSNDVRAYAAGFLEGLLTCIRISEHFANLFRLAQRKDQHFGTFARVKARLKAQLKLLRQRANVKPHGMAKEPDDPSSKHARYMLFQMWGVTDGYNHARSEMGGNPFGLLDLMFLNMGGELSQLFEALSPRDMDAFAAGPGALLPAVQLSQRDANHKMLEGFARVNASGGDAVPQDELDDLHWERRLASSGRCSALVRVAAGSGDLLVGHTTWDDYSKMLRIFKYYKIYFSGIGSAAAQIAFSSYPGAITSTDDFYATDTGLVVMETSLEVLDHTVWNKMLREPELPNFVRVMSATRLATSAPHWADLFNDSAAAGSYAAQWMVVDYKRFEVGSPIVDDTLWLVEAVPGATHLGDLSGFLRDHSYWPSFNRPYFANIREASGYSAAELSHGQLYSWEENPRARIFKKSVPLINGLYEMRSLMRRNYYSSAGGGEFSGPGHDISARLDLDQFQPLPNGGIDAKVLNRCLLAAMRVQAVSGPTNEGQVPFEWTNTSSSVDFWPGWPHEGQPSLWAFKYVEMTPHGKAELTETSDC